MAESGFLFNELSDFKKDLLKEIRDDYPKEIKKYIKSQGRKLSKVAKKIAKKEVGTSKGKKKDWVDSKSYHKRFDSSSVFETSQKDICCKAFNNARHAKLIEYGHVNVPRGEAQSKGSGRRSGKGGKGSGFVAGKLIFEKANLEYAPIFEKDTNEFLETFHEKMFDRITKQ